MGTKKPSNRKYHLALLSMILCTACYLGTGWNEKLNQNFGTFVMAIGMALGLYSGANVANTHVMGNQGGLPHQVNQQVRKEDAKSKTEEEEREDRKEPLP